MIVTNEMSKIKCVIVILLTLLIDTFLGSIIKSILKSVGVTNDYVLDALCISLLTGVLLLIALIFVGKHSMSFTFKSFVQGVLLLSVLTVVAFVSLTINIIRGYKNYGGPTVSVGYIIYYLILLFVSAGMGEEILTRVITMNCIRSALGNTKKSMYISIIASSVFFGLIHLTNLSNGDTVGTIGQVIYAIGIGILLAAVYTRTGNIWANIVIHFLFDLGLMIYHRFFSGEKLNVSILLGDHLILKSVLICIFTTVLGLFIVRKEKPNESIQDKYLC